MAPAQQCHLGLTFADDASELAQLLIVVTANNPLEDGGAAARKGFDRHQRYAFASVVERIGQ